MIILPYAKLGTIPFGPARVKGKRKLPVVGEWISICSITVKSASRRYMWQLARVDKIDGDVWFLSK